MGQEFKHSVEAILSNFRAGIRADVKSCASVLLDGVRADIERHAKRLAEDIRADSEHFLQRIDQRVTNISAATDEIRGITHRLPADLDRHRQEWRWLRFHTSDLNLAVQRELRELEVLLLDWGDC